MKNKRLEVNNVQKSKKIESNKERKCLNERKEDIASQYVVMKRKWQLLVFMQPKKCKYVMKIWMVKPVEIDEMFTTCHKTCYDRKLVAVIDTTEVSVSLKHSVNQ